MLDNPILELNLSERTEFCLKHAKIFTIKDLCFRSEQDLSNIKCLGSKAIQEIVEKLNSKGLKLDKDPSGYSRFQKLKICEDPLFPDYDYNIRSFLTLPQTILDELKEIGLSSNWALILEQPMDSRLSKDLYSDFVFVYRGLRDKLLDLDDDVLNITNKTYKLLKSTKDLIINEEDVDAVIKLSILIVRLIDKYVRDQKFKIINPYLKHGFEEWLSKSERKNNKLCGATSIRNRWTPFFQLINDNVYLVPNATRFSGSNVYNNIRIEVYNDENLLYYANDLVPQAIIGGFEILPEKIQIEKPLGRLKYVIKADGNIINPENEKLFRDYIVFDKDGFEITNNTNYSGKITIYHNDDSLRNYAYFQCENYCITERFVNLGDSILINNNMFNFTTLIKPGVSGRVLTNHWIVDSNNLLIPVYEKISYVAFESSVKSSEFDIVINGKINNLTDFTYSEFDKGGTYKYTVKLDLSEPDIYNISVLNNSKFVLKNEMFALDMDLDVECEQLDENNYSVQVQSSFLDNDYDGHISVNSFSGDWLKFNYNGSNYVYRIPLNINFYKIQGHEWRTCSRPLWIDELNENTTLEFYNINPDRYDLIGDGNLLERHAIENTGANALINLDHLERYLEQYDYLLIKLYSGVHNLCSVYCDLKCSIDTNSTEITYDASAHALNIIPYYYGIGCIVCNVVDSNHKVIFEAHVINRELLHVHSISTSEKYTINFYEYYPQSKSMRLLQTMEKEYFSSSELAGKCCKINAIYFPEFDVDGIKVVNDSKTEDVYVSIDRYIGNDRYKGRLYDESKFHRDWFFEGRDVEIEIINAVSNSDFDVNITRSGFPLIVDGETGGISKSLNSKKKLKISTFNISAV